MNPDLHIVESWAEAQDFMRWLGERRPYLAIDTETCGLEWPGKGPDFLRLVQFGDAQSGWALPFPMWGALAREVFETYQGPTCWHNGKYDLQVMQNAGFNVRQEYRDDTMLMARLLNPLLPAGLKDLASRHIDPRAKVAEKHLKATMKKQGWTWATVPYNFEMYWAYAALDVVYTARLAEQFRPQVTALGMDEAYNIELAVCEILRQAERRGLRFDPDYTEVLRGQWQTEMCALAERLWADHGIRNPQSDAQIVQALRQDGWEPQEFTEGGRPKLDEAVLRTLGHEIGELVVQHRRLRKWTSSYLQRFLTDNVDGRIHCTINTLQAKTGRMSITAPALQTLPRGALIRDCFIPSDGNALVSLDYDQIEMRVFAHFAREQDMIRQIHAGVDLHSATAEKLYGPGFTKVQRQLAKNTNFSKIFCAGPKKFAETAGITYEMAERIYAEYDDTFPGVGAFMRQVEEIAQDRYDTEGIPYIRLSDGRMLRSYPDKLYPLSNYLIQGTAALVLKRAIVRLAMADLDQHLVLPIHDELLLDVPTESAGEIALEVQRLMEDHMGFLVPITAGFDIMPNRWGDKSRDG